MKLPAMNVASVTSLPTKLWRYGRYEGYPRFVQFGKRVGWWKLSAVAGVVIGIVGTLVLSGGAPEIPERSQGPRTVTLRSVAELAGDAAPLPVVGTVKSQSEAQVRTEGSGQITTLTKELGDNVRAGELIAATENSRERASVLSAEGSYDAARANLEKITRGGRDTQVSTLGTNVSGAQSAEVAAKANAANTLISAYATVDNTVRQTADKMFVDPDTSNPRFTIQSTDSQAIFDAQNMRVRIGGMIQRQSVRAATLTSSNTLETEITTTEAELKEVRTLLDRIIAALNKAVPNQGVSDTTIASYKAEATAARATINASISSLTNTREDLVSKANAVVVAKNTLEQGSQSDVTDIASAEASLKQAQGGLAAARANLEKTIVRAPISGTINSLSIERGDFVSAFTPVATIANNNALEIIAYVTETDTAEIAVGSNVAIEGNLTGVITRIAPALDPVTKKIEVRIGLTSDAKLVNGQAVSIELMRAQVKRPDADIARTTIPISALKVGTTATMVFTVGEDGKLVAHNVTLGTLLGDRVVIESGVSNDMRIVLDARGLKEGDTVTIAQ